MPLSKHLDYDARQFSAQATKNTLQKISIFSYAAVKWIVNFIGNMIKILLAK